MAIVYEVTQNDTHEFISAVLSKNGTPIDLSAAEKVFLHMKKKGTGTTITGIVMDFSKEPANGYVEHQWSGTQLGEAGTWEFEFEIRWPEAGHEPTSIPSGAGKYEMLINPEIA